MNNGQAGKLSASALSQASDDRRAGKDDCLVRFSNVNKTYDERTFVVRDLNLEIRQGEFMTLLGPSGSGKTTTLMMLAGFEDPSSGAIFVGNKAINLVPPFRRNIGVVFQSYALFPHMTVGENVAFPLKMRGVDREKIERRVHKALAIAKIENLLSRLPSQLSGGQQQRVALARALVFDPELVLMDEPLGALDKQLREHMQTEIRALHKQIGVTVVYVTHDQHEALTMSDRIAVFKDGRIEQMASPTDLYERPSSSFVATFIGENNLVDCKVLEQSAGEIRVALPDGSIVIASGDLPYAVAGSGMILSVRPERITTSPTEQQVNQISGHILELTYLGDHARMRMKTAGNGSEFVVKIGPQLLNAGLHQGGEVVIGWGPSDCRVLQA